MHDVFYSCSEDGTVKWFDLRQKTLGTLIRVSCTSSIGDRLYSMSLDPMSGYKLVVGGEGSRVSEFDIRLCKSPSRFYEPSDQIPWFWGVTSVAHSSDGRRLAVSFGGTESQIHLLDLYDPSPEVRADSIIFDQNSSPEEIPAPKKYRELNGHQNDRTVKEVTFIGPNSEIVASGR
jgi:WD40 repeat protein